MFCPFFHSQDRYILGLMGILIIVCIWHAIIYFIFNSTGCNANLTWTIDVIAFGIFCGLYVFFHIVFLCAVACVVSKSGTDLSGPMLFLHLSGPSYGCSMLFLHLSGPSYGCSVLFLYTLGLSYHECSVIILCICWVLVMDVPCYFLHLSGLSYGCSVLFLYTLGLSSHECSMLLFCAYVGS